MDVMDGLCEPPVDAVTNWYMAFGGKLKIVQ